MNCYCTNRSSYIKMFEPTNTAADISILWSGHRILSYSSAGNPNYNRSCSSGDLIVMLCKDADLITLIHEMAHQFGARDHYHEPTVNGDDSTCKFKDICSECGGVNARDEQCVMFTTSIGIDDPIIICDDCKAEILEYLQDHYT